MNNKSQSEEIEEPEVGTLLLRLSHDLREAAKTLSMAEARYLVNLYYDIQHMRVASREQIRSLSKDHEPSALLNGVWKSMKTVEGRIKTALDIYTDNELLGITQWAKQTIGIGPVIAAGLRAHIEVGKEYIRKHENGTEEKVRVETAGALWRYAGLDPSMKWEKGEKRPWNATLKTLCAFKLGESFVKFSNNPKSLYGGLYKKQKELYKQRNEAGAYKERALEKAKTVGKSTEAYKHYSQGLYPPAHIHAMARRYAVKIFLSHYFDQEWRLRFKTAPPKPFSIGILGHTHFVEAEAR